MARRGLCSRREAEALIARGAVLLDGRPVREQGATAALDAKIRVLEDALAPRPSVVLNKPPGVVSTQPEAGQEPAWRLLTRRRLWRGDPDDPAVAAVLRHPRGCHVAGRLDRASRGLLLLTADGVVARLVTGSNALAKTYRVTCDRAVGEEHLRRLRAPMALDGRPLLPMRIERLGERSLRFVLREGRRHQIRRVCRAVGLAVRDLQRVAIGPIGLGGLPEGRWMPVPEATLRALRGAAAEV